MSPTPKPETVADTLPACTWTLDDATDSCLWETSCGAAFQFTDGGPEDNEFKFCYRCGKVIETLRNSEEEEGDDE